MALTALDPNTALIVVDLQKGIVGLPGLNSVNETIARAAALARAFRAHGLPVVLVNVAGRPPGRTEQPPRALAGLPPDWTDLIPELHRQPTDLVVTKRSWGAFTHTGLEATLKARCVTQTVIAGIATATGVEATARQAYEHGFNVTLAIDAMDDAQPHAHRHTIREIFPRLGETGATSDIIQRLSTRAA